MAIVPTPASKLLPCIVYGITVPCRRVRVRGGMRDHEHIYPHSPGAGVELLGRDLYKIEIEPIFDARLLPAKYKNLWPEGLRKIREEMDKGTRKDIQIPTVGKIPAYAKDWEQEFDATRCVTGEHVVWHFIEDSENLRLSSQAIKMGEALGPAYVSIKAQLDKVPTKKRGLWDTLMNALDSVIALRDAFEMYSNLIESKLLSILSMLKQLWAVAEELSSPENWPLVQAFHRVWAETRAFYQDQKQLGLITKRYVTRRIMSCSQLAITLFGDSNRASELLQMNGFADPFEIPSGTSVKYYAIE